MRQPALLALLVLAACTRVEPEADDPPVDPGPQEVWSPGIVYPAPRAQGVRGFLDLRGLVHAHSVYSHDACDNLPVVDGVRDPVCFDDFRVGLCMSKMDFVFLSDHRDAFVETEFPDALLYRPDRGDVLVERDGAKVASFAACPDGETTLVMAGTEAGLMPVGLEGHAAPPDERDALYGARDAASAERFRQQGAVVLLAHPEDFTVEELLDLPLDGFEMFNLHANTVKNVAKGLEIVTRVDAGGPGLPHGDALLIPMMSEDARYLERWAAGLSTGRRIVSTMGTDCHRNSFPAKMPDGERIDSYRRMMVWFSNHLLVKPAADGRYDDRDVKEALREGRLYGVFEAMGHVQGFDFRAEAAGEVHELGSEVALADAPTLYLEPGTIRGLDPSKRAPAMEVRLLRAEGREFVEVARTDGAPIAYVPDRPGAYRAEVRMIPYHLEDSLGDWAEASLAASLPWIYANPIYVR